MQTQHQHDAQAPPLRNDKARELGGGAGLEGTALISKQRYCGASRDPVQAFRQAIFDALGGYTPEHIEPGRYIRFPTNDKRGDFAGWCFLYDDMRGGVFGDWRSGSRETWHAADPASLTPSQRIDWARQAAAAAIVRAKQQHETWAYNEKRNAALWATCKQVIEGDPAHHYLCRRLAIDEFDAPPCLRLHPALPYWHDGKCIVSVQPSHLDSRRRFGEGVHLFRRWTPCRRGQRRQGGSTQMS